MSDFLTDEQLGQIAYKGFDDYWAEDSDGDSSKAWTASAKAVLAASPVPMASSAGEAVAWALRFDDDTRLNLSTVFDTEAEAKEYVERCGAASIVPLYLTPPAASLREQERTEVYAEGRSDQYADDGAVVRLLLENCDDADKESDGRMNTTRIRELLTHFDDAQRLGRGKENGNG